MIKLKILRLSFSITTREFSGEGKTHPVYYSHHDFQRATTVLSCIALTVFPLKSQMEVGLLLLQQYSNCIQKYVFKTPERCLTFSFMFFQTIHPVTQLVIDKTPVTPAVRTQSARQQWLQHHHISLKPNSPTARGCSSCLMTSLGGI